MALNKIYTLQSLQVWGKAYQRWWWDDFSNDDIRQGIQLLENSIRSFELQNHFLLLQTRLNGVDAFMTIDLLPNGALSIQPSQSKDQKSMAAAGLLLLEKLLEAHINDLFLEGKDIPLKIQKSWTKPQEKPSSTCKLTLSKQNQGLFVEIWFQRDGIFEKLTSLEQNLKPRERETLMSIMLQLQKYGFHWHKNGLLSSALESFKLFVAQMLPKLSEKHFVECPEFIKALAEGEQAVKLTLIPSINGYLSQEFRINGKVLEGDWVRKSLKAKRHIYWSETHGLIRWQENTLSWLYRINDWQKRFADGQLPSYLSWSIFNPNVHAPNVNIFFENSVSEKKFDQPLKNFDLRSYQLHGVWWLKQMLDKHYHPLLADEMGLGKTRQLLALLSLIMGKENRSAIVVCPASVISAWQNECEHCFSNIPAVVFNQETLQAQKDKKTLFLASYSQILHNITPLKTLNFCCAILDEAQVIKNPRSKTAYACFNLKATYRLVATGTPLENNFTDLWTLFHFLMPGLLGNFKEFQKFIQKESHRELLRTQIAPFVLRRTQKEVLQELPEKQEHIVYCPMINEQKSLYDQCLATSTNMVTGQWMQLLGLILRLRQICCFPGLLPGYEKMSIKSSGKLNWLLEKLAHMDKKAKIIIFSQFKTLLNHLLPHIQKIYPETYFLSGQTPLAQRRSMIQQFQQTKSGAAFLISLKAGGTGITLHSADFVFILDPWWNPAVEQQAIARAYRLGQNHALKVYRLLTENSIESNIQKLQREKSDMFSLLFEHSQSQTTKEHWIRLYKALFEGEIGS